MIQTLIEPEAKRSVQIVEAAPVKKDSLWKRLVKHNWKESIRRFFSKETVVALQKDGRVFMSLMSFLGLVLIFLFDSLCQFVFSVVNIRHIFSKKTKFGESKWDKITENMVNVLETKEGVKRTFLIGLAFRNMKVKKMRSIVTVGGVALGIGAIVFLVSLGYGVQKLVVGRVAKLDDLKMADILLGKSSLLKLDENAINTIAKIEKVEKVLPVVSLVGSVDYKGATSEVVSYAVTGDYLKAASLTIEKGEFFKTEEKRALTETAAKVAGASTDWNFENMEKGSMVRKVNMNILEGEWLKVREEPSTKGKILGYVKRYEGGYDGTEYWGDSFASKGPEGKAARDNAGNYLGKWVKAPYLLFEKKGEEYVQMMDNNLPDWREGYVAELTEVMEVSGEVVYKVSGDVLGVSTESATIAESTGSAALALKTTDDPGSSISAKVVGVDSSGMEWVELEGGAEKAVKEMAIPFASTAQKVAIVNKAFLEATGIDVNNAVGEVFKVSLLVSKAIRSDLDRSARSESVEYKIAGVFDGGNSPVMYIPLNDVLGLGVNNYSQAKLVVGNRNDLADVRTKVDGYGYQTSSVADTVAQIDSMFVTIRLILASFGFVALAVASLGMFNTMTVSLMERTHEVGVMKAMGMLSSEVKELFIAEAMVMGILGGFFGVMMGFLGGQILSLALSVFSLANGIGWVNVSYIPFPFVVFVLILSFVVGVSTGIYPARRATKISALDALRYE